MTSLLCVKSNRGIIVNENQELYEKFIREHTKIVPCLIKEKNFEDGSICDYDSYIHSDSNSFSKSNHTKSNLNSSKVSKKIFWLTTLACLYILKFYLNTDWDK